MDKDSAWVKQAFEKAVTDDFVQNLGHTSSEMLEMAMNDVIETVMLVSEVTGKHVKLMPLLMDDDTRLALAMAWSAGYVARVEEQKRQQGGQLPR